MKRLEGHTTPETAFVVDDYPYGFRLRCKIRYWLEYRKGYGYRFVSQTTNPKKAGEVWNKEKAGTYCDENGLTFLYLDDENHVTYACWLVHSKETSQQFLSKYREMLTPKEIELVEAFIKVSRW